MHWWRTRPFRPCDGASPAEAELRPAVNEKQAGFDTTAGMRVQLVAGLAPLVRYAKSSLPKIEYDALDVDTLGDVIFELCETVAEAVHWNVPKNYPITGDDAFRTATGVHAAAMVKAEQAGDKWVYERVYTGVPAELASTGVTVQVRTSPLSKELPSMVAMVTEGVPSTVHWYW